MAATEEAAVRRERARMRRGQLHVDRVRDDIRLFPRVRAPKQEHDGLVLAVKLLYHAVGENFPAHAPMAVRLVLADGQHRVQQQHALLRPMRQAAVRGRDEADIALQLLIDISAFQLMLQYQIY